MQTPLQSLVARPVGFGLFKIDLLLDGLAGLDLFVDEGFDLVVVFFRHRPASLTEGIMLFGWFPAVWSWIASRWGKQDFCRPLALQGAP